MTDLEVHSQILDARVSIDRLDDAFLNLLAERGRVVEKIIYIKKRDHIELDRSEARKDDVRKLIENSSQLHLEASFLRTLLDLVFRDALLVQITKPSPDLEMICRDLRIEGLRFTLKNLDWSISLILTERFSSVKRIGLYKRKENIPPLDRQRWRAVLESKVEIAKKLGINVQLVKDIFNGIHQVALTLESHIE